MRLRSSRRGFTLIEMLMTVAISSLVIAGMTSTFISQAQQYRMHSNRRAVQAHGRQGLTFMESTLRRAGYGVDPWLAVTPYDSFDVQTNDYGVNFPDAITVLSRDLSWKRSVDATRTTTAELAFMTPLTEPLQKGQILLVLGCNATKQAYLTVGTTAAIGATKLSLSSSPVTIETPITGPGARFHQQSLLASGTDIARCLVDVRAMVVKINRVSFFINSFAEKTGDARALWTPYLMQHPGRDANLDGLVDINDATPLAANVEQLQYSYVLNTNSDAEPVIKGTDPNIAWKGGTAWDNVALRPDSKAPYADPSRLTDSPANVRQIRATVVTRGPMPDPTKFGGMRFEPAATYSRGSFASGAVSWRQLENLNGTVPKPYDSSAPGFLRNTVRMTVATKNFLMRTQFLPVTTNGG